MSTDNNGAVMEPLRSSAMTLRPKHKIRRKNKRTRLQELYDEGKVTSEEFYKELTVFIKWRLMPDLIKRGYYINGVKQNNFTRDECDACYTHVLKKILTEYKPEKGTLATYIRWQIRGWGQLVIQKQVRTHKYMPQGTVSLDSNNIYNIKLDEYRNRYELSEITEKEMDTFHFGDGILSGITTQDVDNIRQNVKNIKTNKDWIKWIIDTN
jgi:hypothetical protein